jgi:hypothetical protein
MTGRRRALVTALGQFDCIPARTPARIADRAICTAPAAAQRALNEIYTGPYRISLEKIVCPGEFVVVRATDDVHFLDRRRAGYAQDTYCRIMQLGPNRQRKNRRLYPA